MKTTLSFKSAALLLCLAAQAAHALIYEGDLVVHPVTPPMTRVKLQTKLYAVSMEPDWVKEEVFDCEDSPVSQAPGDWDGFFEEQEPEKKAVLLAGKIKGLGLGIAVRMVEDRAFPVKPSSWHEFERTIAYADRRYQTGFSHRVLIKFKRENLRNLGYLSPGCGSHEEENRRSVQTRDFVRNVSREFSIHVSTVPLRPGETERLTLLYDGLVDRVDTRSDYTSYVAHREQNGDAVTYDIQGSRRPIPPRNSLSVAPVVRNGMLYLDVSDSGYVESLDGEATRTIVGTVVAERSGWHGTRVLCTFELLLPPRGGACEVDPNVVVPKGRTLSVRYQLRYRNSRYFTDELSPTRSVTYKP